MKTYDKHMINAQNKRHIWTESEILAVRMCIHKMRTKKAFALIRELDRGNYRITHEQTTKGIEYLRSKLFKVNGNIRNTAFARQFGMREVAIIQRFKRFTFEGLRIRHNGIGYYWTTPIYRVHSKNGTYFDYTMGHWGLPEIL